MELTNLRHHAERIVATGTIAALGGLAMLIEAKFGGFNLPADPELGYVIAMTGAAGVLYGTDLQDRLEQ